MTTTTKPLTEIESRQLRTGAMAAQEAHTKAGLRLAKVLFEIHYGTTRRGTREVSLAVAWGHDSFDEYVEHELHMHVTPAHALVSVYDELCIRRSFPDGTLPTSMAALKVLAKLSRHLPDERELRRWVARAKELSACELAHEADAILYSGGGRPRQRNIGFHIEWKTAGRTMRAIRDARALLGESTNGATLARIVEEWQRDRAAAVRPLRRTG